MDTFLSEVCRVLRSGGRFFFADLRRMDGVSSLREQFNARGLTVEKESVITTNVLTALRLDNARKLELIEAWIPRVFHRGFRDRRIRPIPPRVGIWLAEEKPLLPMIHA